MSETYRTAVVGIGGIGRGHANWMEQSGRMRVVALCDENESLRAQAAEAHPEAEFFTSVDAMMAQAAPDVVSVVVPHNRHADVARAALEGGAHAVVEKPMATTYEDARAMLDAARAAGRVLTVFHNRRLDPWFRAAMKAIEGGLVGRRIELAAGKRYGPGPHVWRGHNEPSGGLMFDWGAHLVDYLLQLEGAAAESVGGFAYRIEGKAPELIDDHAHAEIRFASGALGRVQISGLTGLEPERFRIIGESGTFLDQWGWEQAVVHRRVEGFPAEVKVPYERHQNAEFYENLAAHLDGDAELLVSPESAARVIDVLTAAAKSAAEGGAPVKPQGES